MAVDRAADLIALARELERRDAAVAARIDGVAEVLLAVDDVREHGGRTRAGLAGIPAELEHAQAAERHALEREAGGLGELAAAERELDEIGRSRRASADARTRAEQAVRRTAVAAADAAATTARMRENLEAVVVREAALRAEADVLAVEAREVARRVSGVPSLSESGRAVPGESLEEIEEWGARAHAALFVVCGSLESERERIVQEANALAAAALGEQLGGVSVALVRRRLEESLSA